MSGKAVIVVAAALVILAITFGTYSSRGHQFCKFIRIIINDQEGDPLNTSGVQVRDDHERNIAREGATATQTSYNSGEMARASNAINGETSGDYNKGDIAHTASGSGQYWQLVLSKPSVVKTVTVFDRTNCCIHRLGGTTLEMYDQHDEMFIQKVLTKEIKQSILQQ